MCINVYSRQTYEEKKKSLSKCSCHLLVESQRFELMNKLRMRILAQNCHLA